MKNKSLQKVCTVVFAVALFALLTNFVSLFIDTVQNFTFSPYNGDNYLEKLWTPLSVDLLVAMIAAALALAAGITSLFVKKPRLRLICIIVAACAIALFLAVAIHATVAWYGYYNWSTDENYIDEALKPIKNCAEEYAAYLATLSEIVQGLIYTAVIEAILLGYFLLSKKESVPAPAEETEE